MSTHICSMIYVVIYFGGKTLLEVKELTYQSGNIQELKGLSFSVDNFGGYGILSARKKQRSIIAQILCGAIDADSGEVIINGECMNRHFLDLKKKIRLVPSCLIADVMMTPVEYLDFVGQTLDVEPEKRYRQIKEALELVGIDNIQNKLILKLNSSEKCRLSIAAALIGNPEIIVFEDPFSIIDEKSFDELCDLVGMLSSIKILIFILHTPSEIKRLCSHVAIISDGKIAVEGNIEEIEKKINTTHELYIKARGDAEKILNTLNSIDCIVNANITSTEANGVNSVRIEHYPDEKIKDILFEALSAINTPMLAVHSVVLTLDDVYFSLTSTENENTKEAFEETKEKKKLFARRK